MGLKLLQGFGVCVGCELLQAKVKNYHGRGGVCHIQSVVGSEGCVANANCCKFLKKIKKGY